MKRMHPGTYIGLVMVLLLIISNVAAMIGFKSIHDRRIVLVDLHQLRSDIVHANLALRNAAIATNDAQMENELGKMLITRKSANDVYDGLTAADLSKLDKVIVIEMKAERPEYREKQLAVVALVRKGKTSEAWEAMSYYQTLMDRYLNRVDTLIKSVTKSTHVTYRYVQATMMIVLAVSIMIAATTIWRVFR